MIVDAHNDLLLELAFRAEEKRPFATHWLPKLRAGGVGVQVCPIFVELEDLPELGLRRALAQVQAFHRAARECPDDVAVVRSAADLDSLDGRIGLVLSLEGVEPLGYDPWVADVFWELGVRMVSLTWNRRNPFADGLGEISDGGLSGSRQGARPPARRAGNDPRRLPRVRAHLRPGARDRTRWNSRREPRQLPRSGRHTAQPLGRAAARTGRPGRSRRHARASLRRRRADRRAARRPCRPHRLSCRDRPRRPGRRFHRPDRALGGSDTRTARTAAGRDAARRLDRRSRRPRGLPHARRCLAGPGLRGPPARRRPRRQLAPHTQAKGLPG